MENVTTIDKKETEIPKRNGILEYLNHERKEEGKHPKTATPIGNRKRKETSQQTSPRDGERERHICTYSSTYL